MVSYKINISPKSRENLKFFKQLLDDNVMYEIHDLLAKMCDPYVPMYEGVLSQSVEVYKDHIHYPGPYAHYQYIGEVYGPNIPIFEDGVLVGFWSPPQKQPTGRKIQYNTEKHMRATREWDKAMLLERGDVFVKSVKKILTERFNELKNG